MSSHDQLNSAEVDASMRSPLPPSLFSPSVSLHTHLHASMLALLLSANMSFMPTASALFGAQLLVACLETPQPEEVSPPSTPQRLMQAWAQPNSFCSAGDTTSNASW
eukprot:CAMPEP_0114557658 /NCGR_PEP_ID=MMETSP0114-20121206/9951_1 /TAXON_ID=31324 /ORGANISM="Goniomonas sp, Strain m" /LENGTH=106 /DNA_ID=CAMNT_0001742967 /DNA_START=316 /DNA_END=634 /DNA_ORIENTATION=+